MGGLPISSSGPACGCRPPGGQYDPDKALNIGTNHWSFKPELGFSKALGPLTLELLPSLTFSPTITTSPAASISPRERALVGLG